MDLDELLDLATPRVTARTTDLQEELQLLAAESEAAQRRRRPMRFALAGGVVAGVLGLGTVASAAGILPGWTLLTTGSGQTCEVAVHADLQTPGDAEGGAALFDRVEQEETLAAAQKFLEGFDYDSIDRDEAIARWRAVEDEIRAQEPDPAERQPRLEGDDLEVTAVTRAVVERMRADLAAQGYDLRAISVTTSSSGCEL